MENQNNVLLIVETALLCAQRPLAIADMMKMFPDTQVTSNEIESCLSVLQLNWRDRGLDLVQVASGWRFQSKPYVQEYLIRLSPQRAPRYSRAVLETLAIIAWHQPVTRGDIEDIRGVAVSSQIIRTLEERNWIESLGHKDAPGRPALFGTTKQFLDDLGLCSLDELPEVNSAEQSKIFSSLQNTHENISIN